MDNVIEVVALLRKHSELEQGADRGPSDAVKALCPACSA
jgi:hypothetical protein